MGDLIKNPITLDYRTERKDPGRIDIPGKYRFSDNPMPLPEAMGRGMVRMCCNGDGLGFGELSTPGALDKLSYRVAMEGRFLKLPFILSHDPLKVGIEGKPGWTIVDSAMSHLLPHDAVGIVNMNPGVPLELIAFFIPESRIMPFLEEREVRSTGVFMERVSSGHYGKTTPEIVNAINQIRCCHMRGSLRCLYLEGKILELIALRFQEILYDLTDESVIRLPALNRRDRERIREAAEIISANLDHPLSIGQLSRKVGINSTKLKKGFHSELGNTVFGFIHHLRMELAFQLLRDTEKNISEVAYSVGYANLSAFSAAFKKDFGISPSAVRRGEAAGG